MIMDYDVIVIGGGHAGIEAALSLARMGAQTLMITQNLDTIGKLSCNPAIGGLAKGNLVREIDALGGEMARLIDATMIQFRMLNRSKGPAVQAPRAQADRAAYSHIAKGRLEQQENLSLFQDTVSNLIVTDNAVSGVTTERGLSISSRKVVLTSGTFMEATVFIGDFTSPSGRLGEPAAVGLGAALRRMGFQVGRLKTGTPARVLRRSLDLSVMKEQKGEERMLPFSFTGDGIDRPSVSCYVTYTNPTTHKIIQNNIGRSPLYSGKIKGIGPRYCPSIEDKVKRFPDRERHQIFVEPEGLGTEEMYLNGLSSSLPEEVQREFLRTIRGLEDLVILRPGYAVEYDYLNPTQLYPSLETKLIRGLFLAGQTNGTSGYEEAAAQGLLAGINAALSLDNKDPFVLPRTESYAGVLVDDLVTLGTDEPYRLFTSRAEHRLALRHDTADIRLTDKGYQVGLQTEKRMEAMLKKKQLMKEINALLEKRRVRSDDTDILPGLEKHIGKSFRHVLKDPKFHFAELSHVDDCFKERAGAAILDQVELDVKYEGYIKRQAKHIHRVRQMERIRLNRSFDYDRIVGLSAEAREKLKWIRPASLGQASRISGVRQSDLSLIMLYTSRRKSDP